MTKPKEDKLFQLITRLTPTEKGYINKRLKQHISKSNIFKLFQVISNLEHYDEIKLAKKIKNKTLLKNLSITKKMLFGTILKHLRTYHAERSPYKEVLNSLRDIDFLFEKQLLSECEKLIKKGIDSCNKLELYGLKIHFLDWEKRLLGSKKYENGIEKNIHNNIQEIEDTLEDLEISNEIEHKQLLLHHHLFHKQWSLKNEKDTEDYIKILEKNISLYSPLINESNSRAKTALIDINSRIAFKKGEISSTKNILKEGIQKQDFKLIHPLSIEKLQRMLMVNLGLNILSDEEWNIGLLKVEELQKEYPLLKKINHSSLIINTYKIQRCYLLGHSFTDNILQKLKIAIDSEKSNIPMAPWISFHISRYNFSNGHYKDALTWNLKTLNHPKSNIKNFIYVCKFNMLMILLETENYNKLEQEIADLIRFIKRRKELSMFEKDMIDLFRKAGKNWNKNSYSIFKNKFLEVAKIYENEINQTFFYLDIFSWVNAKEKGLNVIEYKRLYI